MYFSILRGVAMHSAEIQLPKLDSGCSSPLLLHIFNNLRTLKPSMGPTFRGLTAIRPGWASAFPNRYNSHSCPACLNGFDSKLLSQADSFESKPRIDWLNARGIKEQSRAADRGWLDDLGFAVSFGLETFETSKLLQSSGRQADADLQIVKSISASWFIRKPRLHCLYSDRSG